MALLRGEEAFVTDWISETGTIEGEGGEEFGQFLVEERVLLDVGRVS